MRGEVILPGHGNTPWERAADFEWTERAFEYLEQGKLSAEVRVRDGVISTRVWGNCPRCGGQLDDRQVHSAVTNVLGSSRGVEAMPGPGPAVVPVDVTCGCGRVHDGAPEEKTGCGVSFRVEFEAVDLDASLPTVGGESTGADPAGAAP